MICYSKYITYFSYKMMKVTCKAVDCLVLIEGFLLIIVILGLPEMISSMQHLISQSNKQTFLKPVVCCVICPHLLTSALGFNFQKFCLFHKHNKYHT